MVRQVQGDLICTSASNYTRQINAEYWRPALHLFFSVVNTTPLLKDLYQHITPQYAADWEVIGTLLGLPNAELRAIEAGYPTNVKWCCNQMLKKWLEVDTTASWGKLFSVIESPAVSCSAPDKGD